MSGQILFLFILNHKRNERCLFFMLCKDVPPFSLQASPNMKLRF